VEIQIRTKPLLIFILETILGIHVEIFEDVLPVILPTFKQRQTLGDFPETTPGYSTLLRVFQLNLAGRLSNKSIFQSFLYR
jgi:hypothetical protein